MPSLNRETLRIEWKPVLAVMKKTAPMIRAAVSQTGRMQGNTLDVTPDLALSERAAHDQPRGPSTTNRSSVVAAYDMRSPGSDPVSARGCRSGAGNGWSGVRA